MSEVGTASDNEDHVSEESDESEDVSASDEEQVNEPSTIQFNSIHLLIPENKIHGIQEEEVV